MNTITITCVIYASDHSLAFITKIKKNKQIYCRDVKMHKHLL